ncbi:MAG: hypothetical protein ABIY55_18445 [Kofleriaceae bacterium]
MFQIPIGLVLASANLVLSVTAAPIGALDTARSAATHELGYGYGITGADVAAAAPA